MGLLQGLWHYLAAKDPALNADQRISRWVNIGAVGTIVNSVAGGLVGWLLSYPWAGVAVGLALWFAFIYAVAKLGQRPQLSTPSGAVTQSQPEPVAAQPAGTESRQPQEVTEPEFPGDEIGATITQWTDTHPWIKKDEMDSDPIRRRSIHIADFALRRHAGDPRGFVLKDKTFDDCHIYGPAILAPLDTGEAGGKTFVRCQRLNGEGVFWWPTNYLSEHPGTVKLEDCLFRDCIFTNVGVVGSPERDGEVNEYQP